MMEWEKEQEIRSIVEELNIEQKLMVLEWLLDFLNRTETNPSVLRSLFQQ